MHTVWVIGVLAAAGGSGGTRLTSAGVIVALVSALGAITAAVIAGRSATRSKQAEIRAAHAVELEKRLAVAKTGVFEPFIEAISEFLAGTVGAPGGTSPVQDFEKPLWAFAHWVQIYGTDDTVRATAHLTQASYADAPPIVLFRLLAELLLQLRRELGDPMTALAAVDLVAIRTSDTYFDAESYASLSDPLDTLYARHNWTPPWAGKE
jgi:hypothetical protein